MPSTYSTSLKLEIIPNGDQSGTWGTTTNTNLNLIEQAVAGVQTITMTNANYTLTNLNATSDEARNMVIVVSGSISSTYQVIAPLVAKTYIVTNSTVGGYNITFGGSGGTLVTIPNGYSTLVYCDGSNFYAGLTSSSGDFKVLGGFVATGNASVGGLLSVSGNTVLSGSLTVTGSTSIVPVGSTMLYPSSSAPSGFLVCGGQAVSRGTYAALFALVGTTFGSGDGSTTFNLPSLTAPTNYYYVIKF